MSDIENHYIGKRHYEEPQNTPDGCLAACSIIAVILLALIANCFLESCTKPETVTTSSTMQEQHNVDVVDTTKTEQTTEESSSATVSISTEEDYELEFTTKRYDQEGNLVEETKGKLIAGKRSRQTDSINATKVTSEKTDTGIHIKDKGKSKSKEAVVKKEETVAQAWAREHFGMLIGGVVLALLLILLYARAKPPNAIINFIRKLL